MGELNRVYSLIETLSQSFIDLHRSVRTSADSNAKSMQSDGAMAAVHAAHGNSERRKARNESSLLSEMAGVAPIEQLEQASLPEWMPHTSVTILQEATASHRTLLRWANARTARGLTPEEYARLAAMCFAIIRDLNDYARSILRSTIDMIRAGDYAGSMHSDLRPTEASLMTAVSRAGVYGEEIETAHSELFSTDQLDLLSTAVTPYETPGASAPPSPPRSALSDDEALRELMAD